MTKQTDDPLRWHGTKPRVGRTPEVLRKSGPMRDRTKYKRKPKYNEEESE